VFWLSWRPSFRNPRWPPSAILFFSTKTCSFRIYWVLY
jgi:hypothetical protein